MAEQGLFCRPVLYTSKPGQEDGQGHELGKQSGRQAAEGGSATDRQHTGTLAHRSQGLNHHF